eukprot:CAMPEP_0177318656 /NCGR_PEP_ID=MMETSP0368-20130122/14190_1 /TAXON_ID=447022 ORGANISM="Scrippsiella hangoei-like, Strain SHHI-4" /NCGR_SAMPLE_ID=MMETSP0368 /ASSEMBLY_ACC=CAM_ASM_000363 /LENGTH=30 /DNA_ID= /DNA_START= /DNA_END= /DNA_ORIENTATION=
MSSFMASSTLALGWASMSLPGSSTLSLASF